MRAEQIFLKAIEKKSLAERAAFLDGACGEDADLRAEVDALLASDENADSFLEQPLFREADNTIDSPPISERTGSMIGPYKLLEKIGEGGFGVVFMAEQQKSIVRKVALKVIKPGMDTKEVIARFEAERQALALMDHPHIARVLDAGATESGRPYFVMELVRGIPITDYCDQNNLAFRERLELFTSVCQAVQHAHQKGIIHRDVKPNNVLVTLHDGKPVVKVIDFGVAKAIDRRLTERTLFTRFSEMIGTPLYMSPEQAEMSGLDVDTRTDIYSLGVLLYELLTGSTPFDRERLGKAAYDEIRRIIREEEPPKPSMRVSTMGGCATAASAFRRTEPKKLCALLKGDLDWIVMKALEKDRTRRYATAKDFADDVQHFLTDQPVEARAPSHLYRFQKLVRRYRVASATVAAIIVTLIAATVFSTWMAVREVRAREQMQLAVNEAERERQLAREEAEKAHRAATEAELSFEVIVAAIDDEGESRLQPTDATISEALQRLADRLDASQELNHHVQARLTLLIAKIYLRAGNVEVAELHLARAADIRFEQAPKHEEQRIAYLWIDIADLTRRTGHEDECERAYRKALQQWDRLAQTDPANAWYRREIAHFHNELGRFLQETGRLEEAEQAYERGITLHAQLAEEYPKETVFRDRLGEGCGLMVRLLASRARDEHSGRDGHDSWAFFERIADNGLRYEMLTAFGSACARQGRWLDAEKAFFAAIRYAERMGFSEVQQRHEEIMNLSNALFRLRKWEEAENIHQDFLRIAEGELERNDPRVADHRAHLAFARHAQGYLPISDAPQLDSISNDCQIRLADAWLLLAADAKMSGDCDQAVHAYRQALEYWEKVSGDQGAKPELIRDCAYLHNQLGDLVTRNGSYEHATRAHVRSIELLEQLVKDDPEDDDYRGRLAWSYRSLGRVLRLRGSINEATSRFGQAVATLKDALARAEQSGDTDRQSELWNRLGNELRLQGRLFEAIDAHDRALQVAEGLGVGRRKRQAESLVGTSWVLMDLRDWHGVASTHERFVELVEGRTAEIEGDRAIMQYMCALALDKQGLADQANALRATMLAAFQTASELDRPIWHVSFEQTACAELLGALKQDEPSLREATRMLTTAKGQYETWMDVTGWWCGVSADVYDKLGQQEEALRHARISLDNTRPTELWARKSARNRLVRLLVSAGHSQEAEDVLRAAVQDKATSLGADHVITHYARIDLAKFLMELNQYPEAEDLVRRAHAGLLSETRVPASQKERAIRLLGDVRETLGKPQQSSQ